jgi:hypothetical protein
VKIKNSGISVRFSNPVDSKSWLMSEKRFIVCVNFCKLLINEICSKIYVVANIKVKIRSGYKLDF